jgi:RNA polymerase sigma-70 factor, ECF subfamily
VDALRRRPIDPRRRERRLHARADLVPRLSAELVGCSGFLAELLRHDTTADGDLVARLQAGDDAAFETLVRTHGGRLLAVARRFFVDEQDARDVVQEAFLAAFRSIGSFDRRAQLSTWLHRVVVNAALMKLRTRRRRREESIDDLLPRFDEEGRRAVDGPPWEPPTDALLQRREIQVRVRRAIERLPDAYRTVLLLRDIEELDTDESATMLGITPQAVKTRLHRARQALRTQLARELA